MTHLEASEYDLLLLDFEMPHLSGLEVTTLVREKFSSHELPIIIITGSQNIENRNQVLSGGANDYVNKPIDPVEVALRVKNLLSISESYKLQRRLNDELELRVAQRTAELERFTESLINRLSMAGELRDNETGQHVIRVGQYARVLAEEIGLPSELVYMIEKTAPMHDIGKIGIPDSILHKQGRLTEEEREVMNGHTLYGSQLLGDDPSMLIQMAQSIAASHHEKWDGSGYCKGLSGESIPIEGRITAIADVFDALTMERPYKKPWPLDDAIKYISDEAGTSFDPTLVEVFNKNIDRFLAVKEKYSD
ncbi:MAG: HD domain-containing protein [Chromatiales bacterium]|nr:HD domain-containing protein [Chromatiales bacterium]